ncbi:MAG: hypothetical protein WBN11_02220 [Eudoraea sp.]|uniref:hypothetical protein n=1 Tax=Eudoraea sp. TaxID=1979955 RepID=UPI003C77DC29
MASTLNILAQSASSLLKDQVSSFFSPLRENVFLHLNKTTFIKGETIWFAAYVYDQTAELPSFATTNLYVALYNSKGLEIEKKLIRIDNGVGHGHFPIDDDFTDSDYYLRAWTNWMNNFESVEAYFQRIEIVNSRSRPNASHKKQTLDYMTSVAIFPEGGKLITAANNTIGFHIRNTDTYNNPITSITLMDDQGNILKDGIPVDSLGFGKIDMYIEPTKEYQLKATFENGKEIIKVLPMAIEIGMTLNVASIGSPYVNLSITINQETLEKEEGNVQFLLFRKNNKSFIKELILDSTNTIIKIPKQLLYKGLNSVTLFNTDLVPQSERLFFNDHGIVGPEKSLNVDHHFNNTRDSVVVKIAHDNLDSLAHCSVSILPAMSIAYGPSINIESSLLIQPYLNFAFNSAGRNPEPNNTDLQLLMNGGGSYPWKVIEEGYREGEFSFESGIGLSGKILDADLANEEQIWFYTKNAKNAFYTTLKDDKTFSIKETLYKGDSLFISVLEKKGKLRKPKIEVNFDNNNTENTIIFPEQELISEFVPVVDFEELSLSLGDRETIDLDEVIVEGSRNRTSGSFLGQANHLITQEDAKRYGSLASYLTRLGFRVSIENSRLVVTSNRFPHPVLPVFIDGMYSDGSELITWSLSMVSEISYDSNTPKAISITVDRQGQGRDTKKNYEARWISYGYAISVPYEVPNYLSIENNAFQLLGAVHWEPDLILKGGKESYLSFPLLGQEEFILYFEGMDFNGNLISQKEFISIK